MILPRHIIAEHCARHGVTVEDILGQARYKVLVNVRQDIAKALHARGLSYYKIGFFMNRDHTSIMNLVKWRVR